MSSQSADYPQNLAPLDEAIWAAATRESGLSPWETLRALVTTTGASVTTWILIQDDQLESGAPFDRLAAMPGVVRVLWLGNGRAYLCDDPRGAFVFAAVPTPYEGVVALVSSVSSTDDRWERLRRWVNRRVSGLSPVFLNEEDFLALGDALAEHGAVETSRLTARDLADGSSHSRGWPERRRQPRPSHREALAEARRLSVRTITLHVGSRLLVQLRREAGATFYSGDFSLFESVVAGGLAIAARNRRLILVGRERHLSGPSPRPLAVRTRGETFASPEAIVELLETLERQQDTGVAVFHRNPYLHAAVTDYSDGSNFDVFVNDTDELVVIPGYRATVGALARLTDAVGERFAAVEVAEVEPLRPPTMTDFLGDG